MFCPANAQLNLVINGSFEQTPCCPTNGDELWDGSYCVTGWFNPNSADPDYFNQCSAGYGVPSHFGEYQPAKSGAAYAGFFTFAGNITSEAREYVEGTLSQPLVAGRKYCVSFYVCSANRMEYQTDAIGAYLTSDSLFSAFASNYFPVQPQVENPAGNVITDTMNWVLISGEFIAAGGERYITIGSFKSNAATTFDTTSWGTDGRAYYYIDDVSVKYCDPFVSPSPLTNPKINPSSSEPDEPLMIPTLIGSGQVFTIRSLPGGSSLVFYNSLGQIVYSSDNYTNDLSTWELSSGIYFCRLRLPDGTERNTKVYFQQ